MARKKDKPKDKIIVHGKSGNNLTIKQRKFVNAVVKSGNATQAVKDAGYNVSSDNSAGSLGANLLQNQKIQLAMSELLERAGLSETKASELLTEAIISGVGRDSRNSDALRGLDMFYKLLGKYAPKRQETATVSIKLNTKDDAELLTKLDEQMKAIEDLKKLIN